MEICCFTSVVYFLQQHEFDRLVGSKESRNPGITFITLCNLSFLCCIHESDTCSKIEAYFWIRCVSNHCVYNWGRSCVHFVTSGRSIYFMLLIIIFGSLPYVGGYEMSATQSLTRYLLDCFILVKFTDYFRFQTSQINCSFWK